MSKTHWIVIILAVAVSATVFSKHTAVAQELTNTIYVSPALTERMVNPGERFSFELDVRNQKPETKTFFLSGSSFTAPADESGDPQYNDTPTGPADPINWLNFSQKKLVVQPETTATVTVTVSVPANTAPGGYYLAAIISEKNPDLNAKDGPQVNLSSEVGSPILVTVAGALKEEGQFFEIKPRQKIFWGSPVYLDVRFKNTGNVHLKPKGIITIEKSGDKRAASLDFNESGANTLPNSIRRYEVKWEPEKLFGIIPAFGKYSVKPMLGYGNPLVFENDLYSPGFLLLPLELLKVIAIVALVLAVLFFGFFKAGQRGGRRHRRKR